MSKKFITNKEIDFIRSINKEVIQNFIGQEIYYYAISPEDNNAENVYGEQIRKISRSPVKLNGLVNYDNPMTRSTSEGQDSDYTVEVYCQTQELIERNLIPVEGDFIEFAQVFFEISSVTQPQMVFGQANEKIMTKLHCVTAREGQFAAGSTSKEVIDRSHPVQQTPHRKLEGS